MNIEKAAWAAVSGAVLSVFWPWMLAQHLIALTVRAEDSTQE